jgi:hypothetical protein
MNLHRPVRPLAAAFLLAASFAAQAASIALGQASSSGLTAVITPDANESGSAGIYIAAVYGNNVYFRGSSSKDWRAYTGAGYPVAATVALSGSPLTVTVADFDLSPLPGLDMYVGYGLTVADLAKSGHLAKIYTVPASKPTTGTGSTNACDTSQAPAGVSYSQSGSTVNISTNGQCVALPTTSSLCTPPPASSASGQSILTATNITSFSMSGISMSIPGYPNPFDAMGQSLGSTKSCIKNAPAGYSTYNINMDVCYDITAQLGSALQSIPGVLTVTPPVTEKLVGSISSTVVSDCFATDALTIVDAATQEVWVKQGGSFVKVR